MWGVFESPNDQVRKHNSEYTGCNRALHPEVGISFEAHLASGPSFSRVICHSLQFWYNSGRVVDPDCQQPPHLMVEWVAAGQLNSAFEHVLQLSRACGSLRQKTVENKLTCAITTFKDGSGAHERAGTRMGKVAPRLHAGQCFPSSLLPAAQRP